MQILKTVDWKARGVERVRWQIVSIPEGKTAEDFKADHEKDGWEVVGKTKDAARRPALFVEMDAVEYDRKFKGVKP